MAVKWLRGFSDFQLEGRMPTLQWWAKF